MAGVKQKTITCNISFLRHLMEGGCDYNRKNIILQFSIERYEL